MSTEYEKAVATGLVKSTKQNNAPLPPEQMQKAANTAQYRARAVLVARHRDEYVELYQSEKAAIIAAALAEEGAMR